MTEIKFKGNIRNIGTSYVITVPKDFIKHGLLWDEDEWEVSIKAK